MSSKKLLEMNEVYMNIIKTSRMYNGSSQREQKSLGEEKKRDASISANLNSPENIS